MPIAQCVGGPFAGPQSLDPPPGDTIGFMVTSRLQPCNGDKPFGLAIYERQPPDSDSYQFRWFQNMDGTMFLVEFVDGPAKGFHPRKKPASMLQPELFSPVAEGNQPYRGTGKIAGVAIYERAEIDGITKFRLQRIDTSSGAVQAAEVEAEEQKVLDAARSFYREPDYSVYTYKPTDAHKQVHISQGQRKADVDEEIAPLIAQVWRLNLDTQGSCQERTDGENAGKAYIAFWLLKHAETFCKLLGDAGIPTTLKEKPLTIGRRTEHGQPGEKLTVRSANVLFAPSDITRMVAHLQTVAGD